ncbi:MAG TPA: polysaccharide biosynthesis tyrosine autokinase [Gemmatimonadales bacterium]|nr:polysaccharide biosynthesis tyrosine autokinase [Gemmatimonadales bacterium]
MNSRPLPAIRSQSAPVLRRGNGSAAPSLPESESGPDWRRLASALLRFKWIVLLMVVLGLGGAVVATRLLRPIYRAQANVWVDVPDRRGDPHADTRGPIRQGALLDADAWVELLRSYVVMDQVVRDLRLYLDVKRLGDRPSFAGFSVSDDFRPGEYRLNISDNGRQYTLTSAAGLTLERGTVGDSVGSRFGFRWVPAPGTLPAGRSVEFSVMPPRDAATRLGEELQVQMDMNGNFLALELRGTSPVLISKILNAVTQRYVEVAAQLKREKLTELTKILEDQLTTAKRNLDEAEDAQRRFRTRTITLPSDQQRPGAAAETRDPIRASFFDMAVERDQLRRDRDALERLLTQAGGLQTDALSAIGSVQHAPELSNALKELSDKQAQARTYRYHYSEAYPPLQHLAAEITELQERTIPTLARALSSQLADRESELERQVNTASNDLRQIPGRAIEEVRLNRNAELKEQTYTQLQQRYDQARLSAEATVPDVRILDPAVVPQRPVKNTAPRLLLMGLVAGLGLGVLGAIVLDRADTRVRYPEQVSRDLGVPILGAVPHLRAKESVEVIEALRGLRLNVLHEYGAETPVLFTVTSPGPGDGKSFLSANLALAFADGGHRTLLMDGDIRRGTLHRRFKANRRPGLVDYLRGEAGIGRELIVQETPYPQLAFIGCGTRTQRAPEVLGSPAMTQLLAELREQYDVIVVDSPPLTAGVDPFIIGTATGSLLLVLRTGHSHRDVTGAKLEVLDRLPIRLLGAVLNDVPRQAAYGYYAYYSYYLPGYEAVDEGVGRTSGPRVV